MTQPGIPRFSYFERVVHWGVGLTFVFLLLTGLAFSHPALYWITTVVGGGASARVLHPWIGLLFTVFLVLMFFIWMKDMFIGKGEVDWLKAIRFYATHQKDRVPPVGKYNPGQKLFFWLMSLLGVAHLVSGVPMWFPAGFLGLGPFTGTVVNWMRLVHYLTTVGGGLLLIVHVYLGTVAFPGTAEGMLHGRVSRAWARLHHPLWERE